MIISLKLNPRTIFDSKIHKTEEHSVSITRVQYMLRYYLIFLFEKYLFNGTQENLQNVKDCINLIRTYSSLHKEFMLQKSNDTTGILEDIAKNKPHLILQETEWK